MVASILAAPHPDILISASGRLIALRDPDGMLAVSSNRAERMVRETWLRRAGQQKSATFDRLPGGQDWIACTYEDSCIATVVGRRVLFDLGRVPSPIDCKAADLVIVPQRRINCPADRSASAVGGAIIIDQRVMQRSGAVALYLDEAQVRVETAADAVGLRPWSPFVRSVRRNRAPADGKPVSPAGEEAANGQASDMADE
jgi:hypothetical protein